MEPLVTAPVAQRRPVQFPVLPEVAPVSLKDFDLKMAAIQARIASERANLQSLRDPFFWRESNIAGVKDRVVQGGSYRLPLIAQDLHGDQGIDSDLCALTDKSELPARMDSVQAGEREVLCLRKRYALLETLRIKYFLEACAAIRQTVQDLKQGLESKNDPAAKVAQFDQELDKIILRIGGGVANNPFRYLREQSIELLEVFKIALANVTNQVNLLPEAQKNAQTAPLAALNQRLQASFTALEGLVGENIVAFERPLWDEAAAVDGDVQRVTLELASYQTPEKEFKFKKRMSWSEWAASFAYYPEAQILGKRIETEVAQKIPGVTKALEETFTSLFRGANLDANFGANPAPNEAQAGNLPPENVQQKLQTHHHCIAKLQTELNARLLEVHASPFDAFMQPLLNYVHGLDLALVELRSLLDLARTLASPVGVSVFKAQAVLKAYFVHSASSQIADAKSLETAKVLFSVGKAIEATKVMDAVQDGYVTTYLVRTALIVSNLYKKHAVKDLALTVEEEAVWAAVIQAKPLDSLQYAQEVAVSQDGGKLLPTRVQAYLIKRICHVLYLPASSEIEGELELLLYVLKKDPSFTNTCQRNEHFNSIITAYEDVYRQERREDLLKQACSVMKAIFEAEHKPLEVLGLARGWQACIEFTKLEKSQTPKDQPLRLTDCLCSKLRALEASFTTLFMHERFRIKDVELWNTKDADDGFTLSIELNMSAGEEQFRASFPNTTLTERKGLLLQSFLLKTLSCCLYGKVPQEVKVAQGQVSDVLELAIYKSFRGKFSPHLMRILFENTAKKIIRNDPVGKNELELFMQGPVKEFMEQETSSFANQSLQDALYVMITRELALPEDAQIITKLFIQHKGLASFNQWYNNDYQPFLASTIPHQAVYEAMKQDGLNPALARVVKKGLGTGLEEWEKAAAKAAYFTAQLVTE